MEKDGWTITDDPYLLEIEGFSTLKVDLGAERFLAAEKGKEKIAVEIKSFLNLSQITNFYEALGKFNFYAVMMKELEPDRILFLAIPVRARKTFFLQKPVLRVIQAFSVQIFVYDPKKMEITEWIK